MTRIGFILKPIQNNEARNLLFKLADWAKAEGHDIVVVAEDQVNPQGSTLVPVSNLSDAIDMCVVLGGDGTMLRASAAVASEGIPLLGINLGRLGFLSPSDPDEAIATLAKALAGGLPKVKRMRLQVTYRQQGAEPVTRTALNDVVISQGAMARLIELQAHLDDTFINSYRADGLVVSTPTGSTAYNLAAGGPIMCPGIEAMTVTPICAQGLTNRPLVVPSTGVVRLSMSQDSKGVDSGSCVLTIDGQWAHNFQSGDEVEITASPSPVTIFSSDADYFNILRAKLHWGVMGPGL